MSGFALRIPAAGESASDACAGELLSSIGSRGSDRQYSGVVDGIEVAHALLQSTPESLDEHFPVHHPTLPMWVLADARIDDQERLRRSLDDAGCSFEPASDADLILAAHEVWGDDAQCHLIGDFAYALWNHGELLCARDVMGMRPLWWSEHKGALLVGSTLRVVLDQIDEAPEPDETFIAEFLTWQLRSHTSTAYQGISRLGPGGRLRYRNRQLDVAVHDQLRLGSALEVDIPAAESLVRKAVTAAVRDRLRSIGPVACDVSGGLDSSSIFGLARTLTDQIHALSEVYPGEPHDESGYIDAVLAEADVVAHRIDGIAQPPPDMRALARSSGHVHYYIDSLRPLMRLAADSGCKVRLTGQGGDEGFSLSGKYVADEFRDRDALSTFRRLVRGWGWRGALAQTTQALRYRLVAEAGVRSRTGLWLARLRTRRQIARYPWVAERLVKRIRPVAAISLPKGQSALTRQERYRWYTQPSRVWSYEELDRDSEGIMELRHPFADRRLVELLLRLPNEIVTKAGQDRYLQKNIFDDVLPRAVLQREDKARFGAVYLAAAHANIGAGFAELATHRAGWTTLDERQAVGSDELLERWGAVGVSCWLET